MSRTYHDFFVPIDGTAHKFTMRCENGMPNWVGALPPLMEELGERRAGRIYDQLDLLNHLLKSLPWQGLASCTGGGAIGAIIEAAEARRAEIYGALEQTP